MPGIWGWFTRSRAGSWHVVHVCKGRRTGPRHLMSLWEATVTFDIETGQVVLLFQYHTFKRKIECYIWQLPYPSWHNKESTLVYYRTTNFGKCWSSPAHPFCLLHSKAQRSWVVFLWSPSVTGLEPSVFFHFSINSLPHTTPFSGK